MILVGNGFLVKSQEERQKLVGAEKNRVSSWHLLMALLQGKQTTMRQADGQTDGQVDRQTDNTTNEQRDRDDAQCDSL